MAVHVRYKSLNLTTKMSGTAKIALKKGKSSYH